MIELEINGLSLTLNHFNDMKYPRALMTPHPNLEYSIYGTAIGDGVFFEPKYIWTITTPLEEENMDLLNAIYYEFDLQRRNFTLEGVNLTDTNQRIQEQTISRTVVSDTTVNTFSNGCKSYYAKFKTWFTTPPTYEWAGIQRFANFVLVEV